MSDTAKRNAAAAALELVEPGMRLGLGTGSTAALFVELLAARVAGGLDVVGVATSERTAEQCRELGVRLSSLDEMPELDLGIDGADEFDAGLNLIKGGGGALLREKIVAAACRRFVVITDERKRVALLGAFDLPVEVIQMAGEPLKRRLSALGATVSRREDRWGEPFLSDEENFIFDCAFGATIADPAALAAALAALPGLVEHGLFVAMCDQVIIGRDDGVAHLHR